MKKRIEYFLQCIKHTKTHDSNALFLNYQITLIRMPNIVSFFRFFIKVIFVDSKASESLNKLSKSKELFPNMKDTI
jgi:hypothetical protein